MENEYCTMCGNELEKHLKDEYNKKTGKRVVGFHCPNLNCQEGCSHAGHKWGKWYLLQGDSCKRCGYFMVGYQGY